MLHFFQVFILSTNEYRCEWVRNWRIWKYVIDYFPVDLVKTVDLSPDRHYVIGTCPHGILWYVKRPNISSIRWIMISLDFSFTFLTDSFGVLANTITNHSKWRSLFPNIRAKMLVLVIDMLFPIFRELLLSWGLSDSSPQNMSTLLSQSHDTSNASNKDGFTSNAVILSFGGAREAFLSAPNTYKVFLNERKGFVRMAIQHGAGLVPAIAFGETNVYDTQSENGSTVQKIQQIIKKYTTIAPVLFNGRGFFQTSFGLIPRRHPITLVIGEPIDCVKNVTPSNEEINDIHAMFQKRLIELFDHHKSKYIQNHELVRLEVV